MFENDNKVHILDHPLLQHKLSILRDERTGVKEFREIVSEIAALECYEATRDLPTEEVEIKTPVATGTFQVLAGKKLAKMCIRDSPMPADEQQAAFHTVLEESLEEECCLQVVQAVHDQLCGLMEDHKESHEAEPLVIGKGEVRQALAANGVSQEHIHAFEEKYDQSFGADAQLSPRNLVDPRRVEIKTADVTIKVDPDRTDLVQTRIINGVKYILVRVEEGVEVNGVPVQITE